MDQLYNFNNKINFLPENYVNHFVRDVDMQKDGSFSVIFQWKNGTSTTVEFLSSCVELYNRKSEEFLLYYNALKANAKATNAQPASTQSASEKIASNIHSLRNLVDVVERRARDGPKAWTKEDEDEKNKMLMFNEDEQ